MVATRLDYDRPAARWLEALPVGDGRLGAMCWGLADGERLSLNDDRAWSGPLGGPRHETPADHAGRVRAARQAVFDGDPARAGDLLAPVVAHTQAYVPLGALSVLRTGQAPPAVEFRRGLDLATATAFSQRSWTTDGAGAARIRHETFVSARAGVLVHEVAATGVRTGVEVALTSPLPVRSASTRRTAPGEVEWRGVLDLPVDVRPWSPAQAGEAVSWAPPGSPLARRVVVVVRARSDGRAVPCESPDGLLRWDDAGWVHLVVAVEVADPGADPTGQPDPEVAARRAAAGIASTAALRAEHRRDHGRLFARADLDLTGPDPTGSSQRLSTTDELVRRAVDDDGARRALVELTVAHARYVLITGSRPGTLPLTLQGLWNEELQPPWSSNYTLNINLQMAYWPAQPWALPECAEPLLTLAERLARAGADSAREMYGARGWVAHHNSDGWAQTRSVGGGWADPAWSAWPMGGVWTCLNLLDAVEHAATPGPLAGRVLPVVEGAVRFCLDRLVELPDGTLGTAPSTSPENRWLDADGQPRAVTASSTCDLELVRGLFEGYLRLSAGTAPHGGADDGPRPRLRQDAEASLALLPHPRTGSRGELLEWHEDLPQAEPEHRHTSHLVGLYPLRSIDPATTPGLAAAAATSLELRGKESTGWALAWRMCLWARLRRGDAVAELVRMCLRPAPEEGAAAHAGGLYPNLFSAHPPFQIDGNLGFAAGVAEALVQSTGNSGGNSPENRAESSVDLLPALPPEWPQGRVRGLRTRAGVEVDLTWADGWPVRVRLRHLRAGAVRVLVGGSVDCGSHRGAAGDVHEVSVPRPTERPVDAPRGTP